ncbi:ATP-binding protein [bacterium]|nr:ATP-binding protein [bacterium]
MFQRHLKSVLLSAAIRYPVITLTGPRQSGKTTLVKSAFPDHTYLSLELPELRRRAIDDPRGLMAEIGGAKVILDEVQRAPDLLSYIQVAVDEDDSPGRFVLTGSQNLLLMQKVTQTLAGRTAVRSLLPLSLAELLGRDPVTPDTIDLAATNPPPSLDRWEAIWAGLYPRIHHRNLPPQEWLADYYRTYVERDLHDVLRVMDLDAFDRFVRLVAARTGCELNYSELASDAGISQPTAKQWLTALRVGYLVAVLPPHHRNYRKRLRKRPRLHFLDSGLVCYLLGIRSPRELAGHSLRGPIFESFVAGELMKSFLHAGQEAPLFYWRDSRGREIDILIDLGSRQIPIEVKSGLTVPADAVDNLTWWCGIADNPNRSGVLVHGGEESYELKGMRVRPWYLD